MSDLENYLISGDRKLVIPAYMEYQALRRKIGFLESRPPTVMEIMEEVRKASEEGADFPTIAALGGEAQYRLNRNLEDVEDSTEQAREELCKILGLPCTPRTTMSMSQEIKHLKEQIIEKDDKIRALEFQLETDTIFLTVRETMNGYIIEKEETGHEILDTDTRGMGDGTDHPEFGEIGTEEFLKAWQKDIDENKRTYLEAYFPAPKKMVCLNCWTAVEPGDLGCLNCGSADIGVDESPKLPDH